jgi:hypothetical protein
MPATARCIRRLGCEHALTLGRESAGRAYALNSGRARTKLRIDAPGAIRPQMSSPHRYAPDPGAKRSSHWRVSSITAFDAEARRCISVWVVVRGRRSMARAFSSEPQ